MKSISINYALSLYFVSSLALSGQSPNTELVLPPDFDLETGKLPGLKKTAEHALAYRLHFVLKHYAAKTGKAPRSWKELEDAFGDSVWETRNEWEIIKRRFAFVTSEGRIERAAAGSIQGTFLLSPLYPIRETRSSEEGRFTVWSLNNNQIVERWYTESELQSFSNWGEVEKRIEAAKSEVAGMPPLEIGSAPSPQSKPAAATGSTPALNGQLSTASPPAREPVPATEARPRARPWALGVLAVAVIALLAWSLRGSRLPRD